MLCLEVLLGGGCFNVMFREVWDVIYKRRGRISWNIVILNKL